MDTFTRRFAIDQLAAWHREHPNDGIAALFDRWVLPGEDAGSHGLRVGIRNGYLNLYVKGQSVAELRMFAGWPRLKIHAKYLALADNGSVAASQLGQQYKRVLGEDLMMLGADTIDQWIRTAETYAGDEKRFVDDLVAVTPGTLDLEMGLPADGNSTGKDRTAPRMDLVVAQGSAIAFWEAKCSVNGELRARANYNELEGEYVEGPHVLWQLRRYQKWVGREHRTAQVRDAYVVTAGYLLQLAEMFGKTGPAIDAWRAIAAAAEAATVILPPGIVVADYCPTRADRAERDEATLYKAKAVSFTPHHGRLKRHGATVVQITSKPSAQALPDLTAGAISETEQVT